MSEAETEAQALLRSGALYPERVGLLPADNHLIFVGIKHGAVSLYFGSDPSYHFDFEGRWQRCYVDPSHYLRRLDGSTQAIDRPRYGQQMLLDRRTLDEAEADALDDAIRRLALDLAHRLDAGLLTIVPPPSPARLLEPDRLLQILARISRWDAPRWAEHRQSYERTYGSIPFLPPDSQDALILQATRPLSGGEPSEARSPEAFREHCHEVAALLGDGVISSRNLFLAGPNVLRRPADEVEALIRVALEAFPLADSPAPPRRSELPVDRPHREGIHAMLGASDGPSPGRSDWVRFQRLGLRRVAFGLAFGSPLDPGVPITPRDELGEAVRGAREAGLAVSLVVWTGRFDPATETEERDHIVDLIQTLGFGKGDHVYCVEEDETEESASALRDALAPFRKRSGVKVLPYSLRKQGR